MQAPQNDTTIYTTFIEKRDWGGFTKVPLFEKIEEWMKTYADNPAYDKVLDKKDNGGLLPALTWAALVMGATKRSEEYIDHLHPYVVLDYDKITIPPDEFHKRVEASGFRAIWHETLSSGTIVDDKDNPLHGKRVYGYHLFIESNSCITGKGAWRRDDEGNVIAGKVMEGSNYDLFNKHRDALFEYIGNYFDIPCRDQNCKDMARIMYLPVRSIKADCQWGKTDGKPFSMVGALIAMVSAEQIKANQNATAPAVASNNSVGDTQPYQSAVSRGRGGRDPDNANVRRLPMDQRMDMVRRLLQGISFTHGDDKRWKHICYSVYSVLDGQGYGIFDEWHKAKCPEHRPKEGEAIWRGASKYAPSFTGGALFELTDATTKKQVIDDIKKINGNIYHHTAIQKNAQGKPQGDETTTEHSDDDNGLLFNGSPKLTKISDAFRFKKPKNKDKDTAADIQNGIKIEYKQLARKITKDRVTITDRAAGTITKKSFGVIAMKDHMLIGAGTGRGKTTITADFLTSFCDRLNSANGKAKNCLIVSMEDSESMYSDKILANKIARSLKSGLHKEELEEIFKQYGRPYIDLKNPYDIFQSVDVADAISKRDSLYFEEEAALDRPKTLNDYPDHVREELYALLFGGDDTGDIGILPYHHQLHPDQIIDGLEQYEELCKQDDPEYKVDILVVDYAQILSYTGIDTGVSETEGIRKSVEQILTYCTNSGRLCIMTSQLQNNVVYNQTQAVDKDKIALSKYIANPFLTVLIFQRTPYDNNYSTLHAHYMGEDAPKERVGVLRCNVCKSRETGRATSENTEVLIGVDQQFYTMESDYYVDAEFVKKQDALYNKGKNPESDKSKEALKKAKSDVGTNPAAGDDEEPTVTNPQGL